MLLVHTIILGLLAQACPKYPKQEICLSLQYWQNLEHVADEVGFLPGDKQESVLQVDSITLGVHRQACPKYLKSQVCHIFAISQGTREG